MTIDLTDVQANILRGYRATDARHFALAFGSAPLAQTFVGALVSGDSTSPQITTADTWNAQPGYCLNIGFTGDGLNALGLDAATLAQFPLTFTHGSAMRSSASSTADPNGIGLGDVGASAPDQWCLGGTTTPSVHVLLSLFTDESQAPGQADLSLRLRALFAAHQITEISAHDAHAFDNDVVHFGYRDNISQPTIDGGPPPEIPDMQPPTPTGDMLLGPQYRNTYGGTFDGPLPANLVSNGTYCAFRVLAQDVRAFEDMLDTTSKRFFLDKEMVAAKIVGRWRNGVPLAVSPLTDTPAGGISEDDLNRFDYAPTTDHPTVYDDEQGLRCPMGAHMRRLNPRSGLAMGVPHNRRIVRRGMPYGPAFDPTQPDDGIERGLAGMFICGDLDMHFEFIQRIWVNTDIHTAGLRGTRDALLGYQDPDVGGKFTIRTNDTRDPITIVDLPRLITTRGSLYCFMPGIGGLRHLAALSGPGTHE
jgi:deferrochelatase/peroxidase EfeB